MDIAATKLQLIQHLMAVMDEETLKRVAAYFKKEVPIEEDDITDEEHAEFDAQHEAWLRGDLQGISGSDSVQRLRDAQMKDETV